MLLSGPTGISNSSSQFVCRRDALSFRVCEPGLSARRLQQEEGGQRDKRDRTNPSQRENRATNHHRVLLSARGLRCGRRRHRRRPAQRTTDIVIVPALHLRSPLRHFRLKLFLRERDGIPKVDEHVRDRAPATTGPVSWIGRVLIISGSVEETHEMNNGAFRQERRRIVLIYVLLYPVVVVADAIQRLDVVAP